MPHPACCVPGLEHAHRAYLDVLRADVAELEGRLADLRRQGEEVRRQYAETYAELDGLRRLAGPVAVLAGEDPPARGLPRSWPLVRPHADAIVDVLRAAGRPLRVQEIIAALGEAGRPLPADPKLQYSAIHAALRRRVGRDFARNAWGQWSLLVPV